MNDREIVAFQIKPEIGYFFVDSMLCMYYCTYCIYTLVKGKNHEYYFK